MKTRAAKFVAAIVASILSSANLSAAPENAEQAADKCLTSPGEKTPSGGHWRYRLERGTGRQCWYLKGDLEKSARKTPADTSTAEEPAPAPAPVRTKAAAPRSLSDARAEFSRTQIEPDATPAPSPRPAAPPAAVSEANQPSLARDATMMAPTAAARWPDPMSTANPSTSPPAPAADQSAEVRAAAATVAPPPPKPMPRAVPPVPVSEKPLSLPMLITIVAGGLSVTGMIVSMLFGWRASRPRLTPSAPMPPLDESHDEPRRPGDLYRERKRMRASLSGRRAA